MSALAHAVYGPIPPDLVDVETAAIACSPRQPGTTPLAELPPGSLASITVHAPDNTVERRRVLALALRALSTGGTLVAVAANNKGGLRITTELEAFGCRAAASPRRRHQIVRTTRAMVDESAITEALEAGAPRLLPDLDLWSEPGLFSWDRIDPGSRLLLDNLPPLSGCGADLGCGIGILARTVFAHGTATHMTLIDNDARALACALRNLPGAPVSTLWTDLRRPHGLPAELDFVVMNPPFHEAGQETPDLGRRFIETAAFILAPGGTLWLTANRHLPYEAALRSHFARIEQIAQQGGFKVYAATRSHAPSAAAKDSRR